MMPLPYQVRVCTSMATNALLGPDWSYEGSGSKPEDENDFAGLQIRIQRTIKALEEFDQKIMESHIDYKVSVIPSGRSFQRVQSACLMVTFDHRQARWKEL